MKMKATSLRLERRIERHGDEWEPLSPPAWQFGREALRSKKTGWIYWFDWEDRVGMFELMFV